MPVLTYSEQLRADTSPECRDSDGVGCDGWHGEDAGAQQCICGCHSDWAPMFLTNAQVVVWHLRPETWLKISKDAASRVDRAHYEVRVGFDGSHFVSKRY